MLRGRDKIGIGTSFVGAAPLSGLLPLRPTPQSWTKPPSFLLQPSSKPTVCDDGVPKADKLTIYKVKKRIDK